MQSCGITIFGALIETERKRDKVLRMGLCTACESLIRRREQCRNIVHECSRLSESLIILLNGNETQPSIGGAWRIDRKFPPIFSLNA